MLLGRGEIVLGARFEAEDRSRNRGNLNSKAVHRAYAKQALMKLPSLEAYEQQAAVKVIPEVNTP